MADASQGLEATLRSLVAQELERALRGAAGSGGNSSSSASSQGQGQSRPGSAASGGSSTGGAAASGLSPQLLEQVQALVAGSAGQNGSSGQQGAGSTGSGQTGQDQRPGGGGSTSGRKGAAALRRRPMRTLALTAVGSKGGAESPGVLLAQAQAEFTEELSANLRKLKQVINESRQIAQKMETVLGMQGSGGGDGNRSTS